MKLWDRKRFSIIQANMKQERNRKRREITEQVFDTYHTKIVCGCILK